MACAPGKRTEEARAGREGTMPRGAAGGGGGCGCLRWGLSVEDVLEPGVLARSGRSGGARPRAPRSRRGSETQATVPGGCELPDAQRSEGWE